MPLLAVLARCVPGCDGGPNPIFCDKHWPLLEEPLQKALVAEWNRLRPPTSMTPHLATLLKTASAALELQLHGAGKLHDTGGKTHALV
jgi:hypothetical protein